MIDRMKWGGTGEGRERGVTDWVVAGPVSSLYSLRKDILFHKNDATRGRDLL